MGVVASLRAMTQLECYCACWLIGSGAVLAVSPDKADRRCIVLVLPLSLLAAIFARRQFLAGSSAVGPKHDGAGSDLLATRDFGSPWGRQPRCIGPRALHSMGCLVAKDLGFPLAGGQRVVTWGLALPFGIALAVSRSRCERRDW